MTPTLLERADHMLSQKQDQDLKRLLRSADVSTLVELLTAIPRGKRKVFTLLPPEIQAEVIMPLSQEMKESILPRLSDHMIARFLHFNPEDDATDVLQHIPVERRAQILEKIRPDRRQKIEKLLTYGSETAGGLMDLNFVTATPTETVSNVLERIQAYFKIQKQVPIVILVGHDQHVSGFAPHRTLLLTPPKTTLGTISQPLPVASSRTDREQIIDDILKRKSELACVTDDDGRPLGIIHLRDLLHVAEAEATEDVYHFAGLQREEHPLNSVFDKVKLRSSWLVVNLATAFLAATVVSFFEGSIAKLAMLAVFMPIVAGEGGNAATQAMAVVVRGLAIGEIDWNSAKPVILREAMAGIFNGAIVGTIAAAASYFFGAPPMLGLVLGAAMIINLFVAGLFGSMIPFILDRFDVDPAISSSIFVTTATDVFGFLTFLGLGTLLLL